MRRVFFWLFLLAFTSSAATDYANPGGSGWRDFGAIAVTTTLTVTGPVSGFVDGLLVNQMFFPSAEAAAGKYLRFDFAVPVLIDEATWYQDNAATHGSWKWQGSNNATDWTDIGSGFTMGGAAQVQTELNGNTTLYRYYQLLGVSGNTSAAPWLYEVTFKIDVYAGSEPAYVGTGGLGNRSGIVTATASGGLLSGGTPAELVDGARTNSVFFGDVPAEGKWLQFDFGVGSSKRITEAVWVNNTSALTPQGTWKWQGSMNSTIWHDIGSPFVLSDVGAIYVVLTELSGNIYGFRYYRLLGVSGNADNQPYIRELFFKLSGENPYPFSIFGDLFFPMQL